ncbi:MAG: HAD-IA family hydrolase [Mariprofundaceae bacterium]
MARLILFDCDGTLTNSNGIIVESIQYAFQQCDLKEPADAKVLAALGMSLNGVIISLMQDAQPEMELVERVAALYRLHYNSLEASICLYPAVLDTLQELKRRDYWLAIVTGKSKDGLMKVMQRFDLHEYFYTWRSADCCHSKPHPAMALECMQELGVTAELTSLVGDSHMDIRMAKAAGVRALGVSFDQQSPQVLYDEGAEQVVHQFEDLLNYFP